MWFFCKTKIIYFKLFLKKYLLESSNNQKGFIEEQQQENIY